MIEADLETVENNGELLFFIADRVPVTCEKEEVCNQMYLVHAGPVDNRDFNLLSAMVVDGGKAMVLDSPCFPCFLLAEPSSFLH